MNVRLGINPLTWSNDDLPALGSDIPLERCLAEAAAAGYEGVELGRKFPRTAAVLGPLLAQHRLALASGWYSLKLLERGVDDEWHAMQPHFALLAALGAEAMVCAEVTGCIHGDPRRRLSLRPRLSAAEFDLLTERLSALAVRMRENGIALAYHHHMGTVIQSAADVDALMARTDPAVKLLLDTGHLLFAGGDPAAAAERHAARIAHVHLKDVRPAVLTRALNRDASFLDAVLEGVFTVPGDGAIDFAAVLDRLGGYAGWLVVEAEQDPTVADPVTCAEGAMGYLRGMV